MGRPALFPFRGIQRRLSRYRRFGGGAKCSGSTPPLQAPAVLLLLRLLPLTVSPPHGEAPSWKRARGAGEARCGRLMQEEFKRRFGGLRARAVFQASQTVVVVVVVEWRACARDDDGLTLRRELRVLGPVARGPLAGPRPDAPSASSQRTFIRGGGAVEQHATTRRQPGTCLALHDPSRSLEAP